MTQPTVSIIIPAFNAAAFLDAALSSARAQTLRDIEILVVDDASSDDTAALVEGVSLIDNRVRLLRQRKNAGPSAARNRGIDEASGRWVALLDADDAYDTDRLDRMVAAAEGAQADLCSDNLLLVTADKPAGQAMIPPALLAAPRDLGLAEFVRRNVADPKLPGVNFGFLKPIIRRDFLNSHGIRYDERVRFAEDFALYIDCFRAHGRWLMLPQATYRYHIRPGSLTQVQTVHDLGILRRKIETLLTEVAGSDPIELKSLIKRHQRVVDRCYYYRAFTDDLKAKNFSGAFSILWRNPNGAFLVAEELARQTPIIAAKAIRGGYTNR